MERKWIDIAREITHYKHEEKWEWSDAADVIQNDNEKTR